MAEETKNVSADANVGESGADNTPTVAELQAQLAQANAEKEQLRNSLTKSNSEAAGYKKALREKQTAEEQEAEAKAEAERLANEERETLKAELNKIKAENAYKGNISEDATIQKLIDAVSNADHSAIAEIISNECKVAVANAEAVWLNNRPRVNAGVSDSSAMTKADIMAVKDATERQRLIAENIELFS